jgi:hypothetical protein
LKTLKALVEVKNLRQIIKNPILGSADIMMGLYLVISIICRIYLIPKLLSKGYPQIQTMVIALTISLVLTFIFIIISNCYKFDWRGKKKSSLIAFIVNKLSKVKVGYILLCMFLFVFDPFLFFIYFRNGTCNIHRKILAWILLSLSLTLASFLWVKFGTQSKTIF